LFGSDQIVEIAFYKQETRILECRRQILKGAAPEIVRTNYSFLSTQKRIYKVTANETGGPGHNYCAIPIC
jgi:hypothetical protein